MKRKLRIVAIQLPEREDSVEILESLVDIINYNKKVDIILISANAFGKNLENDEELVETFSALSDYNDIIFTMSQRIKDKINTYIQFPYEKIKILKDGFFNARIYDKNIIFLHPNSKIHDENSLKLISHYKSVDLSEYQDPFVVSTSPENGGIKGIVLGYKFFGCDSVGYIEVHY